jgi:putative ABC transport system substrate-binding protein
MRADRRQRAVSSKQTTAKSVSRILVFVCLLLSVFLPVGSPAQQPTKVPLIGILGATSLSDAPRTRAIRHALREIGYIEGQNILIEERHYEGMPDRRRRAEIATELVRLKVDLIVVAGGNNVVQAAMDATKTIPICYDRSGH